MQPPVHLHADPRYSDPNRSGLKRAHSQLDTADNSRAETDSKRTKGDSSSKATNWQWNKHG